MWTRRATAPLTRTRVLSRRQPSQTALPVIVFSRARPHLPVDRPAPGFVVRLGREPTATGCKRRAVQPRTVARDLVQLVGVRSNLLLLPRLRAGLVVRLFARQRTAAEHRRPRARARQRREHPRRFLTRIPSAANPSGEVDHSA